MRISILSIIISLIGLLLIIKVNYKISMDFNSIDGKTQAYVGLKYLYKIYYIFFGIIGLILSLISILKREQKKTTVIAIIISIITIILSYIDLWKLMI
jgi:uncharacterized membrane protein YqjE